MTKNTQQDQPDGARLIDRIAPQWAGEGAAVLGLALLALSAVLRPAPEVLPDFTGIESAGERKQVFFDFLAPIVASENARVLDQRERLLKIAPKVSDDQPLPLFDRLRMRRLAAEYELAWPGESRTETLAVLERRVDIVPPALALAQAAKESGWGRSRFARQGNNLFGHWCYAQGCGIVPNGRNRGAVHEVASFESVRRSVRRYLHNLNTHPAYQPLRRIRQAERAAGIEPRALTLADGLVRYSQRRQAYVDEVKRIIRANQALIATVAETAGGRSASAAGQTATS